jgi:hypothetical protein
MSGRKYGPPSSASYQFQQGPVHNAKRCILYALRKNKLLQLDTTKTSGQQQW